MIQDEVVQDQKLFTSSVLGTSNSMYSNSRAWYHPPMFILRAFPLVGDTCNHPQLYVPITVAALTSFLGMKRCGGLVHACVFTTTAIAPVDHSTFASGVIGDSRMRVILPCLHFPSVIFSRPA